MPHSPNFWGLGYHFPKNGLFTFLQLWPLNFMQKLMKSYKRLMRTVCFERTDRQVDRHIDRQTEREALSHQTPLGKIQGPKILF